MPAIPDFSVPMTLTSPYGSLLLNQQTAEGIYLLDPGACSFDIEVRSTKDHIPQGDGDILHHRFLTGTEVPLSIQLWETPDQVACDDLLVTMIDALTLHTRGLLNAVDNDGRLAWTVAGGNNRILDNLRMLVYPKQTLQDAVTVITCTLDSEFPYAQDEAESTTNRIEAGGTAVLNNTGTAVYYPVFKVDSTGVFTITNVTTGVQLVWNAPVYAGYAEVNCFRETIYENGDEANLKYGVDELNSDYIYLVPGANTITITGAGTDILWAPAWG
jgi:hypothetical protein